SRRDGIGATGGRLTSYTFDANNRQQRTSYPDGSGTINGWNADGQRYYREDWSPPSVNNYDLTYTFSYNSAQLLSRSFDPLTQKTVSYGYDSNGRRTSMVLGAQTWTYYWNGGNQLVRIDESAGYSPASWYQYYDNGKLYARF